MAANEKISNADLSSLEIVKYPDPRLGELCEPVETVDDSVRALAERMLELMFVSQGVGLAAPQVGVSVRLLVASPEYDPDETMVLINPEIIAAEGSIDSEEGCLSLPGVICHIMRSERIIVRAIGLDGEAFELTPTGLAVRVIQHEIDHLNGMLLVDRMGSVARLSNRRALKDLEEQFAGA